MRRVLIPTHAPDIAPLATRAARAFSSAALVALSGETMGTTWSVKAVTPLGEDRLRALVEPCLALVVAQMSQWRPDSDLSRFNAAEGETWHRLPNEFFRALRYALWLARETAGAYDPTLGDLSELWGFGASGRRADAPNGAAIDAARTERGWSRMKLDIPRRSAWQPGGTRLDLSSIGKGFAVDFVAEALSRQGVVSHLVEIGGELRGSGTKPDLSPWWVEIESAPDLVIALHGLSVATSGDARRYIAQGGRRLSHTLDPRTGHPIADDLASVTVLEASCMKADALATALSVLGAEEGMRFAGERGIAARFVMREPGGPAERITPAFAAMLE